jgi:cytochrome c551/c552
VPFDPRTSDLDQVPGSIGSQESAWRARHVTLARGLQRTSATATELFQAVDDLPDSPGERPMRLPFAIASAIAAVAFSGTALAGAAEDLITSNKCAKCHTATTTKEGPSWASIAEKYKGKADAEAKIVEMLKTGGADDHNKVAASDADLKAIAQIVLSSK